MRAEFEASPDYRELAALQERIATMEGERGALLAEQADSNRKLHSAVVAGGDGEHEGEVVGDLRRRLDHIDTRLSPLANAAAEKRQALARQWEGTVEAARGRLWRELLDELKAKEEALCAAIGTKLDDLLRVRYALDSIHGISNLPADRVLPKRPAPALEAAVA